MAGGKERDLYKIIDDNRPAIIEIKKWRETKLLKDLHQAGIFSDEQYNNLMSKHSESMIPYEVLKMLRTQTLLRKICIEKFANILGARGHISLRDRILAGLKAVGSVDESIKKLVEHTVDEKLTRFPIPEAVVADVGDTMKRQLETERNMRDSELERLKNELEAMLVEKQSRSTSSSEEEIYQESVNDTVNIIDESQKGLRHFHGSDCQDKPTFRLTMQKALTDAKALKQEISFHREESFAKKQKQHEKWVKLEEKVEHLQQVLMEKIKLEERVAMLELKLDEAQASEEKYRAKIEAGQEHISQLNDTISEFAKRLDKLEEKDKKIKKKGRQHHPKKQ